MATLDYTPPAAPTSVDAYTITQTLTRLESSFTTTFTTLATVTLSKSAPTPLQSPDINSQSGLSPSAIGAIIGSILGFVALLALVYCCCVRTDDHLYEHSNRPLAPGGDFDVEIVKTKLPFTNMLPTKDDGTRYEARGPGDHIESRPRRKRKPPMD